MTAPQLRPGVPPDWPRAWALLLYVALAVIALAVLRPALTGSFVSDDYGYIVANDYLRELSLENVRAFFDPGSQAQLYAVGNYSPIHLLLHALEWQIFADRTFGYHLVNVLVHALVGVLFAQLLIASRAPPFAALVAAGLFVVHPANVQAVAWISQLKSTAGLAFAFGALLALQRRRALGLALFVLALLTKALTAFAIPMAAALLWARRAPRRDWAWLGLWGLAFAAYSVIEFGEFRTRGWVAVTEYADPLIHLRSIAAYAVRYLVMAASSWGVSAYHEPDPVVSWLDPWWLAAVPLGAGLLWRMLVCLARREEEGAWWLAAAVSWAPVSQVFPFVHPIADHYLYFILPGLLGGLLLWSAPWLRAASPARARALLAAAGALGLVFAWHSSVRAKVWKSDLHLSIDAARHYPNGISAHLLRARSAAQAGDSASAIEELRAAGARGMFQFRMLEIDPGLAPLRGTPAFERLVRDWAGRWIDWSERSGAKTQSELRIRGQAHMKRGEFDAAERAFTRAIEAGGFETELARRELEAARAMPRTVP